MRAEALAPGVLRELQLVHVRDSIHRLALAPLLLRRVQLPPVVQVRHRPPLTRCLDCIGNEVAAFCLYANSVDHSHAYGLWAPASAW